MNFEESLTNGTIIKKGDYNYLVNPIGDGIPETETDVLDEVLKFMDDVIDKFSGIDKLVTIEAMGIPLVTGLSLGTNIPYSIIRKRQYHLPGEVEVTQTTGYSEKKLYLNGFKKGEKVVIVDDLLSTGGTLDAVITGLQGIGVEVMGILIAISKAGPKVIDLSKKWDIPMFIMADIEVTETEVRFR